MKRGGRVLLVLSIHLVFGVGCLAELSVRIEKPHPGWIPAGEGPVVVEIVATIEGSGVAWLSVGSDPIRSIAVQEGRVRGRHLLSPGRNRIEVRVVDSEGRTAEDRVDVVVAGAPDEFRVAVGWDDPGVDLDLEVELPDGTRISYAVPKRVGFLLCDEEAGGGGEVFVLRRPPPGNYRIRIRNRPGAAPVACRFRVEVPAHRFDGRLPGGTVLVGGGLRTVDLGRVTLRE